MSLPSLFKENLTNSSTSFFSPLASKFALSLPNSSYSFPSPPPPFDFPKFSILNEPLETTAVFLACLISIVAKQVTSAAIPKLEYSILKKAYLVVEKMADSFITNTLLNQNTLTKKSLLRKGPQCIQHPNFRVCPVWEIRRDEMAFERIQDTDNFFFHIEHAENPDERTVSIRWKQRTITIASPILCRLDRAASYMIEDSTTDTTNLTLLELDDKTTVYLDLAQIKQDEKSTFDTHALQQFAQKAIRRIGSERETTQFEQDLRSWENEPGIGPDQRAARNHACREILECRANQSSSLDLRASGLTSIPECIGQLTQLTHLILSYNNLRTLPEGIGQLKLLQKIDLTNNELQTLPVTIGRLAQLKTLNLGNNRLETLSDSIGQLTLLQELQLFRNNLRALPEWIGQLNQLQRLDLTVNRLQTLPGSIGQLVQLRFLNLNSNQLELLPDSIGLLAQLNSLNLVRNQLRALPNTIGQLNQLQLLQAQHNLLTNPPLSILDLPNNCDIYLDDNNLSEHFLAVFRHEIDTIAPNHPIIHLTWPPVSGA